MVVSAPFFHFSLYTRPSVQNSSLLEHTPTHRNAFLSRERERERGPFFLPKAFGRWCCTRRRTLETLSSKALFAFSFSVKEKERENYQMAIGDAAARTNPPNDDKAAPLPIVATENATETTDGGIDRSVHPSGIVPTLQCVLFCSFMCILMMSEMRRCDRLAVLNSIEFQSCCRFLTRTPDVLSDSLSLTLSLFQTIHNTETSWPR